MKTGLARLAQWPSAKEPGTFRRDSDTDTNTGADADSDQTETHHSRHNAASKWESNAVYRPPPPLPAP